MFSTITAKFNDSIAVARLEFEENARLHLSFFVKTV